MTHPAEMQTGGTKAPPMAQQDVQHVQAAAEQVMRDLSGAVASLLCALGDRLGLFRGLAALGGVTSNELAAHTGIDERYAREWLRGVTCAGYVTYEPESERFTLPPEYAMVLAQEGGMMFLGGGHQQLLGFVGPFEQLVRAFQEGTGVPQSAFGSDLWEGMERMSATWFENQLVQHWIPALPEVRASLERGGRVADVGCGRGAALINLAEAFPHAHCVGYDVYGPAIEQARTRAAEAGVSSRVRFEQRDVAQGLTESYDLITSFDAAHDFVEPLKTLRAIRRALRPEGTFLMLEVNGSDRWEEDAGPVGTILYGTSVFYNLPVSRADGGSGLGTVGLPEAEVRRLCDAAGYGSVRRLPFDSPFNVLYEIRP